MTLSTTTGSSSARLPIGGEQARRLRSLVAQRSSPGCDRVRDEAACRTLVIAGGKGGTGRSVIALNLATVFASRGLAAGLLDASPSFGSLEFLAGRNGYWNLSHVLQGSRHLADVVQVGRDGLRMLAGGDALTNLIGGRMPLGSEVLAQLAGFEQQLDWLIVDASGGRSADEQSLVEAADETLIVTTPEPASIAEAYATVKTYARANSTKLGLVVNQADSAIQAQKILDCLQHTAHSFLQVDLHRRGFILRDSAVSTSVAQRIPFVINEPESVAAQATRQLADRWLNGAKQLRANSFFERLWQSPDHSIKERVPASEVLI